MSRAEKRTAKYDTIGTTYNATRRADKRITDCIFNHLAAPKGASILDVGAGTGNYSVELARRGCVVHAVEPSKVMRDAGNLHPNLHWLEGFAEHLPATDDSFDYVISTLAIHHFSDLNRAFEEMTRVLKVNGKIILLAADPRLCPDDSCWLKDYFSPILLQSYQMYKPINEVAERLKRATGNPVAIQAFPVPFDIEDRFFASAWRSPEAYLDPAFRAGVSPLASCPEDVLQPLLDRLQDDLRSGRWDEKYGHYRESDTYEGGYRFLIGGK